MPRFLPLALSMTTRRSEAAEFLSLLTVPKAARLLGMTRQGLHWLIVRGRVPAHKVRIGLGGRDFYLLEPRVVAGFRRKRLDDGKAKRYPGSGLKAGHRRKEDKCPQRER